MTMFVVSLTVLGLGNEIEFQELQGFTSMGVLFQFCKEFYDEVVKDMDELKNVKNARKFGITGHITSAMEKTDLIYCRPVGEPTDIDLRCLLSHMKHVFWLIGDYTFVYEAAQMDIRDGYVVNTLLASPAIED